MRRLWAGLLIAAGCGRFGFDPQELRDADTDATPDDVAPDAFTVCHSTQWGDPQPLQMVNTISHESDPTITADGLLMFYVSNRGTSMGYAIWTASRASTSEPFANPMIVPELDSAGDDFDPSISPDGLTIYFDSDQLGVNHELFVATRASRSVPFEMPVQLPITGEVNAIRAAPFVSADGLDLYYASGGIELAHATRNSITDTFTFVRELDEINAPQTDTTPIVSSDGLELFFESYRGATAEMFRATRMSTQDPWSNVTLMSDVVATGPANTGYGGPELSPDGRTLYLFLNTGGTIDLYENRRSCN